MLRTRLVPWTACGGLPRDPRGQPPSLRQELERGDGPGRQTELDCRGGRDPLAGEQVLAGFA